MDSAVNRAQSHVQSLLCMGLFCNFLTWPTPTQLGTVFRRLEEVLVQGGVEFIDEGDAIGVRVVRQAKTRTHELKKRKPRGPRSPSDRY